LPSDHRLAGADVSHQDAQALGLANRSVETQQRFLLLTRFEQELERRLVSERVFTQLEMMQMLHVNPSHE
jgi:hypothetical protein